jgi:hypothetical protein
LKCITFVGAKNCHFWLIFDRFQSEQLGFLPKQTTYLKSVQKSEPIYVCFKIFHRLWFSFKNLAVTPPIVIIFWNVCINFWKLKWTFFIMKKPFFRYLSNKKIEMLYLEFIWGVSHIQNSRDAEYAKLAFNTLFNYYR